MAAIQQLRAPNGLAVTTAMQTVYQNPVNSGFREIVQVTFNNVDGVNDANVTCKWVDASNSSLALNILPVNAKVAKLDSVSPFPKTLDPGDLLQALASANGDIEAIVEIIGREAV